MNINLIVNGAAYGSQGGYSAYRFAETALQQGHSISQVFFYRDGVTQANSLAALIADEFDSVAAWAELAKRHEVKLYVCISAAERRGVINAEQQKELDKSTNNLHSGFEVAGLGVMHDASLVSDRTVTFR